MLPILVMYTPTVTEPSNKTRFSKFLEIIFIQYDNSDKDEDDNNNKFKFLSFRTGYRHRVFYYDNDNNKFKIFSFRT